MKILHIHPSARMAMKFVIPLVKYEQKIGFKSELIVFKNDNKNFNLSVITFFYFL